MLDSKKNSQMLYVNVIVQKEKKKRPGCRYTTYREENEHTGEFLSKPMFVFY